MSCGPVSSASSEARRPGPETEAVLAVVVCHDGERWLRQMLSALRRQQPRPRHVLAVDTGSSDPCGQLLAEAAHGPDAVLDGVLDASPSTGFGAAVERAVEHAVARWGDPGGWLWLLHDDSAPEPGCLAALLDAARLSPSAGVLGPLAVDWLDPTLVVEAGLAIDAGGRRRASAMAVELAHGYGDADQPGGRREDPNGALAEGTEVLAVPSAGALVDVDLWRSLGGYDPLLPLLNDDLDFGWRANLADRLVLCVPQARMRHAKAVSAGLRPAPALAGMPIRAALRAHGLRTFLVNCGRFSFLLGLPRLAVLELSRACGLLLIGRAGSAGRELRALWYVVAGQGHLWAARSRRGVDRRNGGTRGLLFSRAARLRGFAMSIVRRRGARDRSLGDLSEASGRQTARVVPGSPGTRARRMVGPDALPAGALGRDGSRWRAAGLRRPSTAAALGDGGDVGEPGTSGELTPSARVARPSQGIAARERSIVDTGGARSITKLLRAPPLPLFVALALVSVVSNLGRLSTTLAGGRLLPPQGLAATWSEYLATWHPVAGGTIAQAPPALAVLGVLGAPFGSPSTAVTVLLLGDAPIAGLLAYLATRRMPVRRWVRALVAAAYALMPAATSAIAQGRLDVVVAHLLLPLVLAGVAEVLAPPARGRGPASRLSGTVLTALGMAAIGAFSPFVHLTVLVLALVGFVVVPAPQGEGRRRVAALFTVVLLPLALLLPWPAVLVRHPAVVLLGLGAVTGERPVPVGELVTLTPGGPGAWPYLGGLLLLAALIAVLTRASRAMVPGITVLVLGGLGVAAVRLIPVVPTAGVTPQHGWAGAPLVVAGAGLCWVLLAGSSTRSRPASPATTTSRGRLRVAASCAGVLALLALVAGDLVAGGAGPLHGGGGLRLAAAQATDLARTGRWMLVLGAHGAPARLVAGRSPAFGDDALPPVSGVQQRLTRWQHDLLSGDTRKTRDAVARAVASGVLFVVLPDRAAATRLRAAAGDLVSPVPPVTRGDSRRPAVRLTPRGGMTALYSPEVAHRAVTGGDFPVDRSTVGPHGVVAVPATPPDVGVRVSEGSRGRLLVLAAEDEPGWRATVDGKPAPVVTSWGHLVGVSVPRSASTVRVFQPTVLRDALLLAQAAALLFTVLTAIPVRRERDAR